MRMPRVASLIQAITRCEQLLIRQWVVTTIGDGLSYVLRAEKEESEDDEAKSKDKDDGEQKDNKKDKKKAPKKKVKKDKKNKEKEGLVVVKNARFGATLPLEKILVGKNIRSVFHMQSAWQTSVPVIAFSRLTVSLIVLASALSFQSVSLELLIVLAGGSPRLGAGGSWPPSAPAPL